MDLIPININKAVVTSVSLDFENEKELKWGSTVSLINDKNTKVTSICVSNNSWDKKDQAELSLLGIDLANQIRKEITDAVTLHMNKLNKLLDVIKV